MLPIALIVIAVLLVALAGLVVAYRRLKRHVRGPMAHDERDLEHRVERAEADLANLRTALNETSLGIVIADDHGRPTYANPAAEMVLAGRASEAVLRRELLGQIQDALAKGEQRQRDVDLHSPTRRVIRLRAIPTTDGVVVYIRDLTEQFRVEALRRDFVANAGHELKTPLGALSVLAETLRDVDDVEQRRRLADRLTHEASRMADVVDDILTLSAIESEDAPLEPVVVSDVVAAARDRVAVSAESAGAAMDYEEAESEVWVEGNREQLISAVANLLDNGIKYSARPEPQVTCRIKLDGDDVLIEVEDNGIGIADGYIDRVFERFYRVDRARSRDTGGTGLGLSIVRNVARTHGGTVSVASELGTGSVFEIRLPVLKSSAL